MSRAVFSAMPSSREGRGWAEDLLVNNWGLIRVASTPLFMAESQRPPSFHLAENGSVKGLEMLRN